MMPAGKDGRILQRSMHPATPRATFAGLLERSKEAAMAVDHARPTRAAIRGLLALVVALAVTGFAQAAGSGDAVLQQVDPMIGTGGNGHTFPGATVPFGMIQLSPDTAMPDFKHAYAWAAGYQYGDHSILGFSETHFSGSGHSDLGDVLLMPGVGKVQWDAGDPDKPGSGYRSDFSHKTEIAQPGYYAVTLATSGVRVRADGTVTGYRETRGWAPGRQLWFAIRFSQPMTSHELVNRETNIPYK